MIRFLDIKKITNSFQPALGQATADVVASGSYVRGKQVQQFEESFASFIGCRHCVGVGNGFDALNLILKSWLLSGALTEGDEVIVPANTYIASILAVTENNLRAIFVEPALETYNLDPLKIEKKITRRTRAILIVHLYGRNAMDIRINELAAKYGLKVLEDNAQAAGCYWNGRRTGSLTDAAAHSFFPTKNLGALGDAGAITTDDAAVAEMIRTLGNYGSSQKGVNNLRGVNSRLDELQAAVLNVKLPRLDKDNQRRREIASYYLAHISNPEIILPSAMPSARQGEHVWHLFVIRCQKRDAFRQYLSDNGIETLVHYPKPPHQQLAFREMNDFSYPVTERIHREVVSLPLNPVLEKADVDRIVEVVNGFAQ